MALSSFAKVKFSEINFFVKTLQGGGERGVGDGIPIVCLTISKHVPSAPLWGPSQNLTYLGWGGIFSK